MSELIKRLDRLFLKLDHMALLVEQSLSDAIYALVAGDEEDARAVIEADETIDNREVEIERECIRLLALYQPAAIDLRRICFVIKANNDLERIADLSVSLSKMRLILLNEEIAMLPFTRFQKLADLVTDALHQTVRLFATQPEGDAKESQESNHLTLARSIISNDGLIIDVVFREFLEEVLSEKNLLEGKTNAIYALTSLGRSLERIGDLCTNIAEDVIFLYTGEIVRHGGKQ